VPVTEGGDESALHSFKAGAARLIGEGRGRTFEGGGSKVKLLCRFFSSQTIWHSGGPLLLYYDVRRTTC
jgi:hypothetical protein